MTLPIRCIQICTTTVQGPCEVAFIHNHHIGPEPTGNGTIRDGHTTFTGKLIDQVRGDYQAHEAGIAQRAGG